MEKFLAHSNKRYLLTEQGKIYDNGIELIPKLIDNQYCVKINWLSDIRIVPIALLLIITYFEMLLPDDEWLKIIPLYIDGDYSNISLSNLTYKFESPIEHSNLKGFYYIPFSTGYLISTEGIMFSTFTNDIKKWSFTKPNVEKNSKGGYAYTRLRANSDGVSRIVFRHRTLCLTFKDYGCDINSIVVNHLDGIPGNDDLSNLEWSTYSKNNQHAYNSGLRPNASRKIEVLDLKTNCVTVYNSISECTKAIGLSDSVIRYRIKHNSSKVYSDFKLFKYSDENREWPNIDLNNVEVVGKKPEIMVKNIFTNVILIFSNISTTSKHLEIDRSIIYDHVNRNTCIPNNGLLFRYLNSPIPFPEFNEDILKIFKKYPVKPTNGYYVTDVNLNHKQLYLNINELSEVFNIPHSTIYRLSDSKYLLNDRFKIETLDIRKVPLDSDI